MVLWLLYFCVNWKVSKLIHEKFEVYVSFRDCERRGDDDV